MSGIDVVWYRGGCGIEWCGRGAVCSGGRVFAQGYLSGGHLPGGGVCPDGDVCPPLHGRATTAVGTHPIGMHPYLKVISEKKL